MPHRAQKSYELDGTIGTLSDWARLKGCNPQTLARWIKTYGVEAALRKPVLTRAMSGRMGSSRWRHFGYFASNTTKARACHINKQRKSE